MVVEVLSVNEYGQSGVRQNTKRLAAQKEPGKALAPVRPHDNEIAIARLGFLHDPFRCKLILNVESFAGYADALSLFSSQRHLRSIAIAKQFEPLGLAPVAAARPQDRVRLGQTSARYRDAPASHRNGTHNSRNFLTRRCLVPHRRSLGPRFAASPSRAHPGPSVVGT